MKQIRELKYCIVVIKMKTLGIANNHEKKHTLKSILIFKSQDQKLLSLTILNRKIFMAKLRWYGVVLSTPPAENNGVANSKDNTIAVAQVSY